MKLEVGRREGERSNRAKGSEFLALLMPVWVPPGLCLSFCE